MERLKQRKLEQLETQTGRQNENDGASRQHKPLQSKVVVHVVKEEEEEEETFASPIFCYCNFTWRSQCK